MHSATTGQVHLFTPGWMFAVYLPSAATWTLNSSLTHIRVMFIFANVISPTLRPAFRLWALGYSNFCGNCRKLQRDDILYFLCSLQPGFIDTILYPAVVHCTVHQSCKRIQNQIEAIVALLGWLWHDKRQYLLCSWKNPQLYKNNHCKLCNGANGLNSISLMTVAWPWHIKYLVPKHGVF